MNFPEPTAYCGFSTPLDSNIVDTITYIFDCPADMSDLLSSSIKGMIEEIEQVYGEPYIYYYPLPSSDESLTLTKTTLTISLNNRSEGEYNIGWIIDDMTIFIGIDIEPNDEYDTGSILFMSNKEYATDHTNPTPMDVSNGDIIVATDYECVCPLSVEISDEANYYVFLDYTAAPPNTTVKRSLANHSGSAANDSISFYIEAGKTVEIDVPIGIYKLYYATGDVFYNSQVLFGEDTQYFASDELLTFYANEEYYMGHTLTLFPVVDGDFETDPISAEEFPFN